LTNSTRPPEDAPRWAIATSLLSIRADRFLAPTGEPIRLCGVALGGWLNMENFITGYSANEALMRSQVGAVLGEKRAERFFERLLSAFFSEADADFLAACGFNCVRIPVNYRHLEDDRRPFEIMSSGFAHLDRAIGLLAERGIYSVIDLHALPGGQNAHWHSDNPTHIANFFSHPHFQDRVVHLWEAIADRYKDHPFVGGYNPVNEPADETRVLIGPYYSRLVSAIRAVDPHHLLFLDGNTYSTEFDIFTEPFDNAVYVCHDYVPAGLGYGGPYPGETRGIWHDATTIEQKFLERTEFARRTNTPIWVGEFGPVYTGDPAIDAQRQQILADQLDLYRRYNASWSLWTYKDVGTQGLAYLAPDTPYRQRFDDFVAKKRRLAADSWGTDGVGVAEVTGPVQELIAREFPDFHPYPWGRFDWVRTLLNSILIAQPLAEEYAQLFTGLGDDELDALADSFAFANCLVREPLRSQLHEAL
jgi:aryl-phospho-beta-D-glucosidase BglC (GH1 family)